MLVSEKAKDIQNKRPTTWKKNINAKQKWASDAQLTRWAARVIEYRACGLSWEECRRLIYSKEMTPYIDSPSTVLEIARWRLENVDQDKMTMPPAGWTSDESIDSTSDEHIRYKYAGAWLRSQQALGRLWEEGESWLDEFNTLYPEATTDNRQALRDLSHSLAQEAATD